MSQRVEAKSRIVDGVLLSDACARLGLADPILYGEHVAVVALKRGTRLRYDLQMGRVSYDSDFARYPTFAEDRAQIEQAYQAAYLIQRCARDAIAIESEWVDKDGSIYMTVEVPDREGVIA
jgi:hypothetical protein